MAELPEEGLYPGWTSVAIDGDRLEVRADLPGPAGVAVAELPDGSVWEVDHADPSRLVAVELDIAGAADSPLLRAAFGAERALEIVDSPAAVSRLGPIDLADVIGPSLALRLEAGRSVLLADLIDDPTLHPFARLVAALELITATETTAAGSLLVGIELTSDARLELLAASLDEDEIVDLTPQLRDRILDLVETCRVVVGAPRLGGPGFRRLLRLLESTDPGDSIAVGAVPMREFSGRAYDTVDDLLFDMSIPYDHLDIDWVPPWGVRVSTMRADEQRWVRVLRRDGLVLLAQAPLQREGLMEVAELVIPPDVVEDDVSVELCLPEDLGSAAKRPAELIAEAVRLGRRAAEADRLGSPHDLWARCGQMWSRVGDTRRAAWANGYGGSARRRVARIRLDPLLADQVSEDLGHSA